MSQQPEPPASIGEALTATLRRIAEDTTVRDEPWAWVAEVCAQAVWDALLAEGRITASRMDGKLVIYELVLPLPLPVVEPRDTEQA